MMPPVRIVGLLREALKRVDVESACFFSSEDVQEA